MSDSPDCARQRSELDHSLLVPIDLLHDQELGDPPHVSVGPTRRLTEPSPVNGAGVWRKSAEVVVLYRHTPLVTGRTEPARTGWSYRCTHTEDLLRPELTGVAFIDQPTLGAFLVDALLLSGSNFGAKPAPRTGTA